MYLGVEPASLSQEGAGDEPEAVADAKLILDNLAVGHARVRAVPLVRAEPRHHEEGEADEHVRGQHVQPNLHSQGIHK